MSRDGFSDLDLALRALDTMTAERDRLRAELERLDRETIAFFTRTADGLHFAGRGADERVIREALRAWAASKR